MCIDYIYGALVMSAEFNKVADSVVQMVATQATLAKDEVYQMDYN